MNSTDAILALVVAQLLYIMYRIGALEARVRELQRQVQTLYVTLNKR